MSPKPAPIPAPDPEFWQLDLDEQIRRARAYTCHQITQPLVELLVVKLIDYQSPDRLIDDQIANLIHGGRAFGRAEILAQIEAERSQRAWDSLPQDPVYGHLWTEPRRFGARHDGPRDATDPAVDSETRATFSETVARPYRRPRRRIPIADRLR